MTESKCLNCLKNYSQMMILSFGRMTVMMERNAISSVVEPMQDYFQLSDSGAGLLRTLNTICLVIGSLIFGLIGDRVNRKWIIIGCACFWMSANVGSTFIDETYYPVFAFLHAITALGHAGFYTVSPTLLNDSYLEERRIKMLAVYYVAFPVGLGLGYIISSEAAILFDDWKWALRISSCLSCVSLMTMFFLREQRKQVSLTSILQFRNQRDNFHQIITTKTYMFVVCAYTCATFVGGAAVFWGPKMTLTGLQLQDEVKENEANTLTAELSSLKIFGLVAVSAGITGAILGYSLSYIFSFKLALIKSNPVICGLAMILSTLCIATSFFIAPIDTVTYYLLFFCGLLALSMQVIMILIVFAVIVKSMRSMAQGIIIFSSHLFGDIFSPYIFGLLTDHFVDFFHDKNARWNLYKAFVCSGSLLCGIEVLGALFYFLSSRYIAEDSDAAFRIMMEENPEEAN